MTNTLRFVGFALAIAGLVGCAGNSNLDASGISTNDLRNDGQIIGGVEATNEDFTKTIVSLYNLSTESLCTATILSDTILLTAAHCLDGEPSDLRVIFGLTLESENAIIKPVNAFQVSPLWPVRMGQQYNSGDIAIVHFSGGLPPGYQAAALLTDNGLLVNGTATLLAGYGISDGVKGEGAGTLRSVETTILDAAFSKTEILVEQSKGKGACHGDSGGPAYLKLNGKLAVWGVTSRGVNDPNNDCSVSAAYTNIVYYASWIARASAQLNKAAAATPSISDFFASSF